MDTQCSFYNVVSCKLLQIMFVCIDLGKSCTVQIGQDLAEYYCENSHFTMVLTTCKTIHWSLSIAKFSSYKNFQFHSDFTSSLPLLPWAMFSQAQTKYMVIAV